MSNISNTCQNEGKHEGMSHYHMCDRCRTGSEKGCADYKSKTQSTKHMEPDEYLDGIMEKVGEMPPDN